MIKKEGNPQFNLELKDKKEFRLINDEEFVYLRDKYHVGPELIVFVCEDKEGDEKYRVKEPTGISVAEWDKEQTELDQGVNESEQHRLYDR